MLSVFARATLNSRHGRPTVVRCGQ